MLESKSKFIERQAELEDDVKKLTVKIDEAAAKSTELKKEVTELQAELAALAKDRDVLVGSFRLRALAALPLDLLEAQHALAERHANVLPAAVKIGC